MRNQIRRRLSEKWRMWRIHPREGPCKNDIVHQGIKRWDEERSGRDGSICLTTECTDGRNIIIESRKAGTNIQEGRQRGGRILQRSGDASHGQPNPRSCFGNTFEMVGRESAATGWQPEWFHTGMINSGYNTNYGKNATRILKKGRAAKQLIGPIDKRKDPKARLLDLQKKNSMS